MVSQVGDASWATQGEQLGKALFFLSVMVFCIFFVHTAISKVRSPQRRRHATERPLTGAASDSEA